MAERKNLQIPKRLDRLRLRHRERGAEQKTLAWSVQQAKGRKVSMSNQSAIAQVVSNRALTRATQVLMNIVTNIMADGQLQDAEVLMLNT